MMYTIELEFESPFVILLNFTAILQFSAKYTMHHYANSRIFTFHRAFLIGIQSILHLEWSACSMWSSIRLNTSPHLAEMYK